MSKVLLVLTAVLATSVFARTTVPFKPGQSLPDGTYQVGYVKDGDTFSVLVPVVNDSPVSGGALSGGIASGGSMSGGAMPAAPEMVERSVRVLQIDTPEVRGNEPFNREATAYAKEKLEGQTVMITSGAVPIDRYGRALAYVTLPDGSDYGLGVISAGLADVYDDSASTLYKLARDGAQSVGKGRWERPARLADRNCGDFSTQAQAQVFFEAAQLPERRDAHRLDPNNDSVPCERLPK